MSARSKGGMTALALALAGWCVVCAAQDEEWSWRVPKEEPVSFHGAVNFDKAGTGIGSMRYPAPSLLVALAAVATHAAVAETMKDSQKARMQKAADKVLEPFESVVAGLKQRELMQRALQALDAVHVARLIEADDLPASGGWVQSASAFTMTQDQRALVLDQAVALYLPGGTEPAYQNTVRVVSRPVLEDDPVAHWSAGDGEKLKAESASLMAESLRLALSQWRQPPAGADAPPERTFRYPEGGIERIERAQMVAETCDRRVLKNLRGWLLSVPRRAGEETSCEGTAATAR